MRSLREHLIDVGAIVPSIGGSTPYRPTILCEPVLRLDDAARAAAVRHRAAGYMEQMPYAPLFFAARKPIVVRRGRCSRASAKPPE